MILCDIGNTTFAFFIKKQKLLFDINTKHKNLPNITNKEKIYFISVNQKATSKLLKKYPDALDIKNIINFNTLYKGMGIDRKVACYNIKNNIIVDVGSAITVDIIKNKTHLGGFILPGIKNFIKFYPLISPKLKFDFEKDINLDKIPTNTNKAISYAILNAIILPILNCEDRYELPIIFTGFDSKYIIKYFKNSKYKRALIFNSMKRIIKRSYNDNNSLTKR